MTFAEELQPSWEAVLALQTWAKEGAFLEVVRRRAHLLPPDQTGWCLFALLTLAGVRSNLGSRSELAERLRTAGILPTDLLTFLVVRHHVGQGHPALLATALKDLTSIPRATRRNKLLKLNIPSLGCHQQGRTEWVSRRLSRIAARHAVSTDTHQEDVRSALRNAGWLVNGTQTIAWIA